MCSGIESSSSTVIRTDTVCQKCKRIALAWLALTILFDKSSWVLGFSQYRNRILKLKNFARQSFKGKSLASKSLKTEVVIPTVGSFSGIALHCVRIA